METVVWWAFGFVFGVFFSLAVWVLRWGHGAQERKFKPTWENLHLLCAQCEHELSLHASTGTWCKFSLCHCPLTQRKAFPNSLTVKQLRDKKNPAQQYLQRSPSIYHPNLGVSSPTQEEMQKEEEKLREELLRLAKKNRIPPLTPPED